MLYLLGVMNRVFVLALIGTALCVALAFPGPTSQLIGLVALCWVIRVIFVRPEVNGKGSPFDVNVVDIDPASRMAKSLPPHSGHVDNERKQA